MNQRDELVDLIDDAIEWAGQEDIALAEHITDAIRGDVLTSTAPIIGYIVVSKQAREDGGFDYIDVSPLWRDRERAESSRNVWLAKAKSHPGRYRDTEFIIAEVRGNA